jgi:rhodanese-related sulfurtransferase
MQPNESDVDSSVLSFPKLAQLNAVRQIDAHELNDRLAASEALLLIDVRQANEYRGELGHIAGSRLVPLSEFSERAGELGGLKDRQIVTVCRVGVRSATAAAILTGLGCEHVLNLKGGMLAWNDARLPVEH